MAAALLLRRRHPLPVLLVEMALTSLYLANGYPEVPIYVACIVALYRVADRTHPLIALACGSVARRRRRWRPSSRPAPRRCGSCGPRAAYRIVQEALTNTARHAGATHVTVELDLAFGELTISVEDDGANGGGVTEGSGLTGMAERVARLGGSLTYGPLDGKGFRVLATLPAREDRAGRTAPAGQDRAGGR